MAQVFVLGAATTRFRPEGCTTADLAYRAADDALRQAGVAAGEIPAVFVGCGGGARPSSDAVAVRLGLRRLGFRGQAAEEAAGGSIEDASESAGEAFHRGCQAIEMGIYELVLCVGAQASVAGAWPPEVKLRERAAAARGYMSESGATVEHLARTSAKNLRNGGLSLPTRWDGEITPERVLESELLAWPLTRLMVAPSGEGAAAVVLASRRGKRRGAPCVRASLLVGAEGGADAPGRAARLAYGSAGVGPEDLDCVEVDDVTAAAELAAYEALQLAPAGQGPELIDSGFTSLGGPLPVNTSGGLLSLGEWPGASGLSQLCQIAWQLRGEAGPLQVAGARMGLAQSGSAGADGGGSVAIAILGM
jgi:acetyl-CoA acetyltransferase